MKLDIDKIGLHLDTTGQPYWSYIIISLWIGFLGLAYLYLKYGKHL